MSNTGQNTLRIALYCSGILAIELSKEWNLVGSERIRAYDWVDWMISIVGVWSIAALTIKAYLDTTYKNGHGNPPAPPPKP